MEFDGGPTNRALFCCLQWAVFACHYSQLKRYRSALKLAVNSQRETQDYLLFVLAVSFERGSLTVKGTAICLKSAPNEISLQLTLCSPL